MHIRSVEDFVQYFEKIRERTRRVIACIPDGQFDWAPAPGKFTFADLIRHLGATERYMFAENALGRPSRYPGHGSELADGPEAVRAFCDRMHAETMELLRTLRDDDLGRKCVTPAGTPISVWKWLRAMVEHEVHHRGQIYLMLGMLGVDTPPLYGLTSEEVRARSERGG